MDKKICDRCNQESKKLHNCPKCKNSVCSACWSWSSGVCKDCKENNVDIKIHTHSDSDIDIDNLPITTSEKDETDREIDEIKENVKDILKIKRKRWDYDPPRLSVNWSLIVGLIIALIIFAVATSVGATVIDTVESQVVTNFSENNIPDAFSELESLTNWSDVIAAVTAAAVILSLIVLFFTFTK